MGRPGARCGFQGSQGHEWIAMVYLSGMGRTRCWAAWGSDLPRFQLCCIEEYKVHPEEKLGNTDRHSWNEGEMGAPTPLRVSWAASRPVLPAGSVQCPILVSLTWPGRWAPQARHQTGRARGRDSWQEARQDDSQAVTLGQAHPPGETRPVLPDSPAGPAGGGVFRGSAGEQSPCVCSRAEAPWRTEPLSAQPWLLHVQGQLSLLAHGGHQHD